MAIIGHAGLAEAVLALHLAVIAFNVFGLVAVPLGAWRRWRFVRVAWWRWLHLASMAAVAVQALLGRACLLTLIQDRLEGASGETPLVMGAINRLIFWPLPMWAFTGLYLALFAWTVALFWVAPVRRDRAGRRGQ